MTEKSDKNQITQVKSLSQFFPAAPRLLSTIGRNRASPSLKNQDKMTSSTMETTDTVAGFSVGVEPSSESAMSTINRGNTPRQRIEVDTDSVQSRLCFPNTMWRWAVTDEDFCAAQFPTLPPDSRDHPSSSCDQMSVDQIVEALVWLVTSRRPETSAWPENVPSFGANLKMTIPDPDMVD
jgi:hypothetical protein